MAVLSSTCHCMPSSRVGADTLHLVSKNSSVDARSLHTGLYLWTWTLGTCMLRDTLCLHKCTGGSIRKGCFSESSQQLKTRCKVR